MHIEHTTMSAFVRRAALLRPSENEFLPRRRRQRSGSHHPTTILKQSASIYAHKLLAASIASHRFEDLFGPNFNVGDNNSNSNGSNHVASSAADCVWLAVVKYIHKNESRTFGLCLNVGQTQPKPSLCQPGSMSLQQYAAITCTD